VGFGFSDAGPGYEEEPAAADGDITDVEGVIGCVAHKGYLTTVRNGQPVGCAISECSAACEPNS